MAVAAALWNNLDEAAHCGGKRVHQTFRSGDSFSQWIPDPSFHKPRLNLMLHFPLSPGANLPAVGLGLWKVDSESIANIVERAIDVGYRHFDSACDYGNEAGVGAGLQSALRKGLCQRNDLWITSKLWNTYHAPEHVRPALEKSLQDLRLDHLDLYLIHFPISLRYVPIEQRYPPGWVFDPGAESPQMQFSPVPLQQTWQAMEELVDAGLVKNIGACNFTTGLLSDLLSYARIRPSVLQVELHPYLTQEKLLKYCADQNIAVTGFSPFGASSYVSIGMAQETDSVLDRPEVATIAQRLNRTPGQIVLRWAIQRGTAVVPKTSRVERLKENISLFDFELTVQDMAAISALNQNRRFNDPGDFGPAAFNTFCPIYD